MRHNEVCEIVWIQRACSPVHQLLQPCIPSFSPGNFETWEAAAPYMQEACPYDHTLINMHGAPSYRVEKLFLFSFSKSSL